MDSMVQYQCNRCKKVDYVFVSEMLKAKKELIPNGWYHIDIGTIGPESYLLCTACRQEWTKKRDNTLRDFVAETQPS